jgi:poly(3-hydroxybutyrate) depolymerase
MGASGSAASSGGGFSNGGSFPGGGTPSGGAIASGGVPASGGSGSGGGTGGSLTRPVDASVDASVVVPDASADDASAPVTGTAGCRAATSGQSGSFEMNVGGTPRKFIVDVPSDYDPAKPYRLVFVFHPFFIENPSQGTAYEVAARGFSDPQSSTRIEPFFGLKSASKGSAILVAPEGRKVTTDPDPVFLATATLLGAVGWDNAGGGDVAFASALLDWIAARYCVDRDRVFSAGFSYGGIMSIALGCEMGDTFRAIASMSGDARSSFGSRPATACKGQVAAFLTNNTDDTTVPFAGGEKARDRFRSENACSAGTLATLPDHDSCVEYLGCTAGHPVVFCKYPGGHAPPPFFATQQFGPVWDFFAQF